MKFLLTALILMLHAPQAEAKCWFFCGKKSKNENTKNADSDTKPVHINNSTNDKASVIQKLYCLPYAEDENKPYNLEHIESARISFNKPVNPLVLSQRDDITTNLELKFTEEYAEDLNANPFNAENNFQVIYRQDNIPMTTKNGETINLNHEKNAKFIAQGTWTTLQRSKSNNSFIKFAFIENDEFIGYKVFLRIPEHHYNGIVIGDTKSQQAFLLCRPDLKASE